MHGEAQLWWGLLFSSIGLGYFIYGRKQGSLVPLISGIGLMAYPYFVPNTYALVTIGGLLVLVPIVLRR